MKRLHLKQIILFAMSLVIILLCQCWDSNPTSPFAPENTKIEFVVKSPSLSPLPLSTFTDTLGTTIRVGVVTNLPSNIDTAIVKIVSANHVFDETAIFSNILIAKAYDTTWLSYTLKDTGEKTISLEAHIHEWKIYNDTILLRVYARINHPPRISVTGTSSVSVGQLCSLSVMTSDPDVGQKLVDFIGNKPELAQFDPITGIFKWTPGIADTGINTILFKVSDDGFPVLSDSQKVRIAVSYSKVNHAPKWQQDTINQNAKPGTTCKLALQISCFDPDSDALQFSLLNGAPGNDTIIEGVYSFLPSTQDTGIYFPRIVAKDPNGLADTMVLHLIVSAPITQDTIPPLLKLLTPADSTTLSSSTTQIRILCKDISGIASVKCSMGPDSFVVSNADSIYSVMITGLKSIGMNEILFIATDHSIKANMDTLKVHIKYLPQQIDSLGPVITIVTPAKDSISTNSSSYTVALQCIDASGVLSVKGEMGTVSYTGMRGSGNNWAITINGLAPQALSTIVFTAIDSSLRANKTLDTLHIKYDPSMDDVDGPSVVKISGPASGSIVSDPAVLIVDSVYDPSGVDSVTWSLNQSAAKLLTPVSGKPGQYSLSETLIREKLDTIVITAVDKSTKRNRSTQTIVLNYIIVPKITTQPASKSVFSGTPAIFSVIATGTTPLTYQWRIGASSPFTKTGTNNPLCTLEAATTTVISCVVSNGGGSDTSVTATLTVLYGITYDINGGAGTVPADANTYAKGDIITVKAGTGLSRTNYTFGGWCRSANSANAKVYAVNDTLVMGEGNLILYAVWTAIPTYSLVYDGNGNTGGSSPTTATGIITGTSMTVSGAGTLIRTGYVFTGWNTAANGSGTSYTAGTSIIIAANTTLYAKWTDAYLLTIVLSPAAGGTVAKSKDTACYISGSIVTLTATHKTGYRFNGWGGDTTASGNVLSIIMKKDRAITANFKRVYALTVTSSGKGVVSPLAQTDVDSGATTVISATPGSGYKFKQWNTSNSGVVFGNSATANTTVILNSEDATVQGVFKGITFINKTIPIPAGFDGMDVKSAVQMNDSEYLVAATCFRSGSTTQAGLIKLDANGNRLWIQTYGSDLSATSLRKTNTGFIIAGSQAYGGVVADDASLTIVAQNGNFVTSIAYGGASTEQGVFAQQTSDNGYIVGGSTVSFTGNYDFYLVKTNASGDTAWTKYYDNGSIEQCGDGIQTNDNGYLLVGYYNMGDGAWAVKTKSNGDLDWNKAFNAGIPAPSTGFASVRETSDGYILGGKARNGSGLLLKMDKNGNTLWYKDTYSNISLLKAIRQISTGGYVIGGATNNIGNGLSDIYIVKTTPAGDIVAGSERSFGTASDESCNSIELTNDGGFLITGSNGWVIKTDENGDVN